MLDKALEPERDEEIIFYETPFVQEGLKDYEKYKSEEEITKKGKHNLLSDSF